MSLSQSELESYLWGAATVLRGTIDAGDYKQFIFPLLFFKRISDVWDEEYEQALDESAGDLAYAAFAENHRFQLPGGAHWKDVRAVATNVGQALQGAMRAIEQANPDKLYGRLRRRAMDQQGPPFRRDSARTRRALLDEDPLNSERP